MVVRFSSIGDIVLTSPIVRCLKEQIKDVEIHFLTKSKFKILQVSNPHIDRLHIIDKDLTEVLDVLKAENYDLIIDLHHNLRTKQLKYVLKVPTYAFPKLNLRKFILTRFKVNVMPKIHIVDRYFETVQTLGVVNDNKGLDYFIPKTDVVNLDDYSIPNHYIAFAIGAQFSTKRLPIDSMVQLLKKINGPIVLLGGSEDVTTALKITEGCQNTIDLTGKLSLNQSASIVEQAQKVISHDTGLMHIAAAFKKPIISIWGNTVPDLGMYPYMPKDTFTIHEVDNLKCRPCSKIGYQVCPKNHFNCMLKQDLESIAKSVNQ